MSEPVNPFQNTRKHIKTGNFSFLSTQVSAWQKLTKLVQPLLPQPEQWQVVCYQNGVLILTGTNQAMISQLGYLKAQYIQQLRQLSYLQDLHQIQVRIRTPSASPLVRQPIPKAIPSESQEMLKAAADFVSDPKLSQAMLRLASNKK
jgi:hypothetical protein